MSLRSAHLRHIDSCRIVAALLLCIPLVTLAACDLGGASGQASPTASSAAAIATPTAAPATMRQVSASASVASGENGPVSATATCPSGTVMLSGGYDVSGANATGAQVLENHPQSSSSWIATAGTVVGGPFTLTTYADCLQTSFPVTTQVVSSPVSVPTNGDFHEASAACPPNTLVTGGGFTSEVGVASGPVIDASQPIIGTGTAPSARAWDIQILMTLDPATPMVYAICASSPWLTESATTARASVTTAPVDLSASCLSGQLLVGGGFAQDAPQASVYRSALAASGGQWVISAAPFASTGTPPTVNVTAFGLCLQTVPMP